MQVTVAARSKAWTVFARLDAGIMDSNPTQGMDVWCVYAFILCLCCPVFSGLAAGWSLAQGVLPSVKNDYGTGRAIKNKLKENAWNMYTNKSSNVPYKKGTAFVCT
jgi:hypothetical protein